MEWVYYLSYPFNAFLYCPLLAFIPAILFYFAFLKKRHQGILAAVILWGLYGIYETYITWVWSPRVIAPIRIDLFPVSWVLYTVSLLGIYFCFKKKN